jgi:hypothetical protein
MPQDNADPVIERDGALIIPAWIGPAKLMVLKRGRAYRFGLFTLTADYLAFATAGEILMQERRADVQIEWPRHLAGSGFHVRAPAKSYAICFGKPFPDAPGPSQYSVAKAATAFGSISALGFAVGQDWLPEGAIVADVIRAVADIRELKHGRSVAAQVRAALES